MRVFIWTYELVCIFVGNSICLIYVIERNQFYSHREFLIPTNLLFFIEFNFETCNVTLSFISPHFTTGRWFTPCTI